jgi:hypothetical protein
VLVDAVGSRVLGKMNAEYLARYDAENPGCARFAAILRQLEEGVAKPKAERVSMRIAISGQVLALKDGASSSSRASRKRNEVLTPSVAAGNRAPGAPMSTTDRLHRARADRKEAAATGPGDMLSLPEVTGEGESSALRLPVAAGDHGQSAAGASELRAAFVDLLRAWRRIAAVIGDDLELSVWLELLQAATTHDRCIDDDELFARLATHHRVARATGSSSVSNELVPGGSFSPITMRHQGGDAWAMAHPAPAAE